MISSSFSLLLLLVMKVGNALGFNTHTALFLASLVGSTNQPGKTTTGFVSNLLPVLSCWCYLFDGVYIGLMQAKAMRNSMIIATFGCFFPVWYILKGYGNHALWAALSIFLLARGLTLAWHYKYRVKVSFVR